MTQTTSTASRLEAKIKRLESLQGEITQELQVVQREIDFLKEQHARQLETVGR